jgi:hypothetical protein
MTSTTLTDRYVDAAMRTVPESQRPDLAAELRGSIDDQIDARVAAGEDRSAAERAVLTELGDPDALAAQYTGRPLYLVGPQHYLDWWRLVTLLLGIVVPLAAFAIALGQALSGADLGGIIGSAVAGAFGVAVNIVFWVTLVFAIVERAGAATADGKTRGLKLRSGWTPDQLPEPRQQGTGVSEVVGGVLAVFAAAAVLLWDRFVGFAPGIPVSFFDPGIWPAGVAYALIVLAIDAVLLVIVHVMRRWTVALAVTDVILTVALVVPVLVLLSQGRLINTAFFPAVLPSGGEDITQIVTVAFGFVFAAIAVWEIVDAIRKARHGARR